MMSPGRPVRLASLAAAASSSMVTAASTGEATSRSTLADGSNNAVDNTKSQPTISYKFFRRLFLIRGMPVGVGMESMITNLTVIGQKRCLSKHSRRVIYILQRQTSHFYRCVDVWLALFMHA